MDRMQMVRAYFDEVTPEEFFAGLKRAGIGWVTYIPVVERKYEVSFVHSGCNINWRLPVRNPAFYALEKGQAA